jgi:CheY-like chemotaxis protein
VTTHDLSGLTVLVVEDDEELRKLLRRWLEGMGARVAVAQNGLQALVELRSPPAPDVILCDLHMPDVNGCAFVAHMRRDLDLAHIPVIALTGTLPDVTMMGTLEAGFTGYVVKPVTSDVIGAQIARALRR